MLYCKNCKKIYEDNNKKCKCKEKYIVKSEPQANDPVYLITSTGFERQRITAALKDYKIPFEEKLVKKSSGTLPIISGDTNSDINIYVPYEFLQQAQDIVIGICADSDKNEQNNTQIDDYNSSRNKFIRAISIVLFFIMLWVVVAGTDAIIAWVKSLF